MRTNTGARITNYEIVGLVTQPFKKVGHYEIAEAEFRCEDIHLFNKHIFADLGITNIPLDSNETTNKSEQLIS